MEYQLLPTRHYYNPPEEIFGLAHMTEIVTFMETHKILVLVVKKRLDNVPDPKIRKYRKLWGKLTASLNAQMYNKRSVEFWQNLLLDWIKKTRLKAALDKMSYPSGDVHQNTASSLSDLEKRLMNIVGWSSVDGDGSTREIGFRNPSLHPSVQQIRCDSATTKSIIHSNRPNFAFIYNYNLPENSSQTNTTRISDPTTNTVPEGQYEPLNKKHCSLTYEGQQNIENAFNTSIESDLNSEIQPETNNEEPLQILREINSSFVSLAEVLNRMASNIENCTLVLKNRNMINYQN